MNMYICVFNSGSVHPAMECLSSEECICDVDIACPFTYLDVGIYRHLTFPRQTLDNCYSFTVILLALFISYIRILR